MSRILVLVLVLAGCSRILGIHDLERTDASSGDGGPDDGMSDATDAIVLAGHDEDGDSVDDAIDNCPHKSNMMQENDDGDGAGNICDPNPTAMGDSIAMFTSFATSNGGWTFAGDAPTPSVVSDRLSIDAKNNKLLIATMPGGPAKDIIELAGTFVSADSTVRFISITAAPNASNSIYYCQLYGTDNSSAMMSFTYTTDGSNYMNPQTTPATAPLATSGTFTLAMDHHPPSASCRTTWPATDQIITATLPAITPDVYGFSVKGMIVQIDWVVRIHTN